MRKILLSIVLVGNLFGGNGEITGMQNWNESIQIDSSNGEFLDAQQKFNIFLNIDKDISTGYGEHLGAEILITSNGYETKSYKYIGDIQGEEFAYYENMDENWEKIDILNDTRDSYSTDAIYIEFTNDFKISDDTTYRIETYDSNWEYQSEYSSQEAQDNQDNNSYLKYRDIVDETYINDLKKIFGNDDSQFLAIEDGVALFEEQGEEEFASYKYAAFLQSNFDENTKEYQERGATVGRIFTTFASYNDFINSDAYQVVKKFNETWDNNLTRLVDNVDDYNANNFLPNDDEFKTFCYLDDTTQGDYYINDKPSDDAPFLIKFAYEWQKLAKQDNDEGEAFRKVQDYIYFEEVNKVAIDLLKEKFDDLSEVKPLTFFCVVDALVLNGYDDKTVSYISQEFDKDNQKDSINEILDNKDLYNEDGRGTRAKVLKKMNDDGLIDGFTFEQIKDIYNLKNDNREN